jgi:hypothetical protein
MARLLKNTCLHSRHQQSGQQAWERVAMQRLARATAHVVADPGPTAASSSSTGWRWSGTGGACTLLELQGAAVFIIEPSAGSADPGTSAPWVWYAPTLLPGLPDTGGGPGAEVWMFERFLSAGIAVAGIDAGESYGSTDGQALFTALHAEMVRRNHSSKPVLLGRSRGGLQTLAWAAEYPESVGAWCGIYPVCDLSSYLAWSRPAARTV